MPLSDSPVPPPAIDLSLPIPLALPHDAQLLAEAVVDTVRESLLLLDSDLRVRFANRSFYLTFGVRPPQTLDQLVYKIGNGQWNFPALRHLLEEILPQNSSFEDFEVTHDFPDIGRKVMRLSARKLRRPTDQHELILLALEDITARKQIEEELAQVKK